jgi:sugar O-acyltransferase (sialic acid O-acetyltransferase NeuD family)
MNLYIYCAGGFGKEVMDVARRRNNATHQWRDIKFVDDALAVDVKYGAQVMSFDQVIANDGLDQAEFLIAAGEPVVRRKIREKLEKANAKLGRLIDVSTVVADTAQVSDGIIITPLCSISSDAVLARNSCVNTMSIIGHDVLIGENSVISSMVNMGGACIVGENSYIGMGALIKEGIKIGSNSIVGMGSVVYNDIPDGVIALGNPARVMRNNADQKVFK